MASDEDGFGHVTFRTLRESSDMGCKVIKGTDYELLILLTLLGNLFFVFGFGRNKTIEFSKSSRIQGSFKGARLIN